jgi:hypothetical protein
MAKIAKDKTQADAVQEIKRDEWFVAIVEVLLIILFVFAWAIYMPYMPWTMALSAILLLWALYRFIRDYQ